MTPENLLQALADLGLKTSTLRHEAVFRVGEGDDIKSQLPGAPHQEPVPQGR